MAYRTPFEQIDAAYGLPLSNEQPHARPFDAHSPRNQLCGFAHEWLGLTAPQRFAHCEVEEAATEVLKP